MLRLEFSVFHLDQQIGSSGQDGGVSPKALSIWQASATEIGSWYSKRGRAIENASLMIIVDRLEC